jgi:ATP-dependent DNA helicase RecG
MQKIKLSSQINQLSGVGEVRFNQLQEVGIKTVADLLDYWPRRYIDYSKITAVKDIQPGLVTVKARIVSVNARWARSRAMHLTEAVVEDDNGDRIPVIWFNQPFRLKYFKKDQDYFFSGEFSFSSQKLNLTNPSVEPARIAGQNSTARIVPIYPEKKGLGSRLIRDLILQLVEVKDDLKFKDLIPAEVIKEFDLLTKTEAIFELHSPSSMARLKQAQDTLFFEEILILQLASKRSKLELSKFKAPAIQPDIKLTKEIIKSLKFTLTDGQRATSWQILQDLAKNEPMNRLLMGDVGSGKTVVAALAAAQALQNGQQVVFIAPTEVLARQHFKSLQSILSLVLQDLDRQNSNSNSHAAVLLLGSLSVATKKSLKDSLQNGQARLIVGTHALLQGDIKFKNISLVVVDEQHRFGVEQRRFLQKATGISGQMPHLLSMSATPIPRSLALILYGELSRSILKELPSGRRPVTTELVAGASKLKVIKKLEQELFSGNKAFIVCPAITDTEASSRVSVDQIEKELSKKKIIRDHGLGLLHGKLSSDQKDAVMADFVAGRINTLVTTTVIEVGVDVPEATVMIIEGAEFFGLAQLHQLRGRVGRSDRPSYCFLIPAKNDGIPKRLEYFASQNDGFKLAEYDLASRGPGQIYGRLQSGALDLRMVDTNNQGLIDLASKVADRVIKNELSLSPELAMAIDRHQHLEILN